MDDVRGHFLGLPHGTIPTSPTPTSNLQFHDKNESFKNEGKS